MSEEDVRDMLSNFLIEVAENCGEDAAVRLQAIESYCDTMDDEPFVPKAPKERFTAVESLFGEDADVSRDARANYDEYRSARDAAVRWRSNLRRLADVARDIRADETIDTEHRVHAAEILLDWGVDVLIEDTTSNRGRL